MYLPLATYKILVVLSIICHQNGMDAKISLFMWKRNPMSQMQQYIFALYKKALNGYRHGSVAD